MRFIFAALIVFIVLAVPVAWPPVDLIVSGWFYRPGDGFFLRDASLWIGCGGWV